MTNRRPFLVSSRPRGFALVFVLMSVALLFTFLVAAQGSVMSGRHHIARSIHRLEAREATQIALAETLALARKEVADGSRSQGEDWSYGNGDMALLLADGDPLYGKTVGLRHREGDILLTLAARPDGSLTKQRFLANVSDNRRGAISLD